MSTTSRTVFRWVLWLSLSVWLSSAGADESLKEGCAKLLLAVEQAQPLNEVLDSFSTKNFNVQEVLSDTHPRVRQIVTRALKNANLEIVEFSNELKKALDLPEKVGGMAPTNVDQMNSVSLVSTGKVSRPGEKASIALHHLRETKGPSHNFADLVFLGDLEEPVWKLGVLIHELAHVRFHRFFFSNLDPLSKILPDHFLRKIENGRFFLNREFFLYLTEVYAYETEYMYWDHIHKATKQWPVGREFWRPRMAHAEVRDGVNTILLDPLYGLTSPALASIKTLPLQQILRGRELPFAARPMSLRGPQVEFDEWFRARFRRPHGLSESELAELRAGFSRNPKIYNLLRVKVEFSTSMTDSKYSFFWGRLLLPSHGSRLENFNRGLANRVLDMVLRDRSAWSGIEILFNRYQLLNFPKNNDGEPLGGEWPEIDRPEFSSIDTYVVDSIAMYLSDPERLRFRDHEFHSYLESLLQ